ncbi:MAG: N-acetylneuraminate synthase family protein [Phycisphaeraceae bacterium]|nr:N-acetylneuraminate synthase family protein [Phycisphaeraceae bacterium]
MDRPALPDLTDPATPPLIVADLSLNHDGSIDRAVSMVASAAAAGADGVTLPVPGPGRYAFDQEQLTDLREETQDADILLVPRIDAEEGLPLLDALACPLVLTGPLADPELYPQIAETGIPFVAAADGTEPGAFDAAIDAGAALLAHVPDEQRPQLGALTRMRRDHQRPVGLLDGSPSVVTGAVAVGAGAVFFFKRFTELRDDEGLTHQASLDPVTFTHFCDLTRDAGRMVNH